MADCPSCQRMRPKTEPHLAADGYVECKASADPGLLLAAFSAYARTRQVDEPFVVHGIPGHPQSAWPLQFVPSSIQRCDGFARVADGTTP